MENSRKGAEGFPNDSDTGSPLKLKTKLGRNIRFSMQENEALVESMIPKYNELFGVRAQTTSAQRKKFLWGQIVSAVNSVGPLLRSEDNCRKRFSDVKRNVKQKISDERKHAQQTGGGKALQIIYLPYEERLRSVLPTELTHGIPHRDTDVPQDHHHSTAETIQKENVQIASSSRANVHFQALEACGTTIPGNSNQGKGHTSQADVYTDEIGQFDPEEQEDACDYIGENEEEYVTLNLVPLQPENRNGDETHMPPSQDTYHVSQTPTVPPYSGEASFPGPQDRNDENMLQRMHELQRAILKGQEKANRITHIQQRRQTAIIRNIGMRHCTAMEQLTTHIAQQNTHLQTLCAGVESLRNDIFTLSQTLMAHQPVSISSAPLSISSPTSNAQFMPPAISRGTRGARTRGGRRQQGYVGLGRGHMSKDKPY